ncbi:hypothetical protein [Nocardia gipuzkoensis]
MSVPCATVTLTQPPHAAAISRTAFSRILMIGAPIFMVNAGIRMGAPAA